MRSFKLAIAPLLALSFIGCTAPASDSSAQRIEEIRACGLEDDSTITADVDVHACAPDSVKKTTICHIPPGNPANAHTLCVGTPSVSAHERHGDVVGPCPSEPPCDGDGENPDGGVDVPGDGSGSDDDVDGGVVIL